MCVGGTPDVPSVPERQSVKQIMTRVRDTNRDDERRRRGMLSTILTSARGVLAPAATTATMEANAPKAKLG